MYWFTIVYDFLGVSIYFWGVVLGQVVYMFTADLQF